MKKGHKPNDEEPGIFEMLGSMFHGKNRWLSILAILYIFLFTGFAIWCAVRYSQTDPTETKSLIAYAAGFLASLNIIGMIKIWFWLDMHRRFTARKT